LPTAVYATLGRAPYTPDGASWPPGERKRFQ
jgi:hypothetical protein